MNVITGFSRWDTLFLMWNSCIQVGNSRCRHRWRVSPCRCSFDIAHFDKCIQCRVVCPSFVAIRPANIFRYGRRHMDSRWHRYPRTCRHQPIQFDLQDSLIEFRRALQVLHIDCKPAYRIFRHPCIGLNGGDEFTHNEAFSFQVATADQAETDRYWEAITGNDGKESVCG